MDETPPCLPQIRLKFVGFGGGVTLRQAQGKLRDGGGHFLYNLLTITTMSYTGAHRKDIVISYRHIYLPSHQLLFGGIDVKER